ncbi:MAG: tRNA (adenosine(37)-N6)-threonylcarbamoyltransferase complex transferase subunit TsaD [Candidatus Staskawiczbacteria bacterium]|nr:tRNA (adenosine(37)-N6)-threonylcarbamoyltransferase complex transferase subunit TsaD [Candidatus Staskawiczbacteria bacterium]
MSQSLKIFIFVVYSSMKILAIETSCDDTGIAIIEADDSGNFNVLANIIASQIKIGKKYGGVFPMMAKREHQKNILPTLIKALKEADLLTLNANSKKIDGKEIRIILEKREPELLKKIIPFFETYKKPEVDFIAITNGPGLEPCLWVGVNFAKCLSYFWNIPIVEVNHIEGHILVNLLENKKINFPAVALVVSGGHTQLILIKSFGKYEILGETRDDAAGECFDKCAKILGLSYPGGPIIAKLSEGITPKNILPRPMINTKDYDFSFSGLKTAVLYADRKIKNKNVKYKKEMAAEVQQAIIDVLLKKTIKAVKDFNAKTLILGGGATANKELRLQFGSKLKKEKPNVKILVPPTNLSTDNGLMVAVAGYFRAKRRKVIKWQNLKANSNLRI